MIETNINDSAVVKRLKDKIVEYGGKALMPVLRGDPVAFCYHPHKQDLSPQV